MLRFAPGVQQQTRLFSTKCCKAMRLGQSDLLADQTFLNKGLKRTSYDVICLQDLFEGNSTLTDQPTDQRFSFKDLSSGWAQKASSRSIEALYQRYQVPSSSGEGQHLKVSFPFGAVVHARGSALHQKSFEEGSPLCQNHFNAANLTLYTLALQDGVCGVLLGCARKNGVWHHRCELSGVSQGREMVLYQMYVYIRCLFGLSNASFCSTEEGKSR